jgi:mRNA interferase YafQ
MYKLVAKEYFKKKFKKLSKFSSKLSKQVYDVMENLQENPFMPSLKTHKVISKNFGESYSSRVNADIRIIWRYGSKTDQIQIILIVDIGGHSGSNKVYQ